MNRMIRFLCLLLAMLMVASAFIGCSNTNPPDETTPDSATETETEAETDPVEMAIAQLREEADWDGDDFAVLYVSDIGGYAQEIVATDSSKGGTSGGVINDAVFERNTLLEEYANLNFVGIPVTNAAAIGRVQGEVQTATGDFELISQTTTSTASIATSGYLADFCDLEIDYEQAWWDQGTLEFALNGHVFFMNGSFNMLDYDTTYVMMFNKRLREEYKIANPYETVKEGTWTLDYFNSVISQLATENGDGKWDEKDTYGFAAPVSVGNTLFYGGGLQYVKNSRDMEGPELVLVDSKMEQALNVLAISRTILQENNSTYIPALGSEALATGVFTSGRALFYNEACMYLQALKSTMEDEYGVLPIPKYNKEQENYATWCHGVASTLSIPSSAFNDEAVMEQFGNVLNLYAVLSDKLVKPAYYEVVLTTRNVQDVESADMLDMIFANRVFDMAMYFDSLGFYLMFINAAAGVDNFSSQYKSVSRGFPKQIERLLRNLPKE